MERRLIREIRAGRYQSPTGGDNFMIKGEAAAQQRRQTGGRTAVTDISLDAADGAGTGRSSVSSEVRVQNPGFPVITVAAAVGARFYEGDCFRSNSGIGVGFFEGMAINALPTFCRGAACAADAANNGVDPVAISLGVFQALEHHGAGTFAYDGTVGI